MSFTMQSGHRLEWALLVPIEAASLEQRMNELVSKRRGPYWPDDDDDDDDDARTWHVDAGSREYSALFETEPGSAHTEEEIAVLLSKAVGKNVYCVAFCGYDDPDHGLPYISVYKEGEKNYIWVAEYYDDGDLHEHKTVPGPESVPCDDPFDFAEALGCALRKWYEYG